MRYLLLVIVWLMACDSSSGATPASECREVVHDICVRSRTCDPDSTTSDAECQERVEAAFPGQRGCAGARSVTDQGALDTCEAQIEAASCESLDASGFPAECEGVLAF